MPTDPVDLLNSVCDQESFIAFLEALAADRADEDQKEKTNPGPPFAPGANGWQHDSIDGFLDAAAAWANSTINGTSFGYTPPENPWRRCAEILYAGKVYE